MGGKSGSTNTPHFSSIQVQSSVLGSPRQIVFGATRIAANILDFVDFKAHKHKSGGKKGGGKGGGKGGKGGVTTYTYSVTCALGLCEGPIDHIGDVWNGTTKTSISKLGLTLFKGTYPQTPWTGFLPNHSDHALGYQGLAYVAGQNIDLGASPVLPALGFEVFGLNTGAIAGKPDSSPSDVANALLTSPHFGANFPSGRIGDMTSFRNYCLSNGLVISPYYQNQTSFAQMLGDLCTNTNTAAVWSSGKLYFVPYGDTETVGNGFTYEPISAPLYDLGDDDFLDKGGSDGPVKLLRARPSDQFNKMSLEFLNRTNSYNTETVDADDPAAINQYGLIPAPTANAHMFCDTAAARTSVQLQMQRQAVRNGYSFSLSFKYIVLDPMDVVTITETSLGLVKQWVRILSVTENEDGSLDLVVEEYLNGSGHAATYQAAEGSRYASPYDADPGSCNPPVIFEPPLQLYKDDTIEVWNAVSGGVFWGGCEVWASDDGSSYSQVGAIAGSSTQGVLVNPLALATGIDQANTLLVDLSESLGDLPTVTPTDVTLNNQLAVIDGEIVSFGAATLVGPNLYALSYLGRGLYSSGAATHVAGAKFAYLGGLLGHFSVDEAKIGSTIYLKFRGFNIYGTAMEDLSVVQEFAYKITGAALASALVTPSNVTSNYFGGVTLISWNAITDPRTPIDYEVRRGSSFSNAQILGRTSNTNYVTQGDGTYWVSAHYQTPQGGDIFSGTPTSIVIAGSTLVANVVATYDEYATSFSGTTSGFAVIAVVGGHNTVQLSGAGDFLSISDFLAQADFLNSGNIGSPGIYEPPSGHQISLPRVATCGVSMTWDVFGNSSKADFLSISDFLGQSDFLTAQFSTLVDAQPQLALSIDGGSTWGAWQNFVPGQYTFNKIKFRMVLSTTDPTVTPVLDAWAFTVDVPDLVQRGTGVATLAGGSTITYPSQFTSVTPNLQITIAAGTAVTGDTVKITGESTSGFTVQVLNVAGVGVVRTINWLAQGY